MSAEHDYASPAELRDQNLERRLDSSHSVPPATASPTPRMALWVSIIAGVILVIGMSIALSTVFDEEPAPAPPQDTGSVSAMTTDEAFSVEQ